MKKSLKNIIGGINVLIVLFFIVVIVTKNNTIQNKENEIKSLNEKIYILSGIKNDTVVVVKEKPTIRYINTTHLKIDTITKTDTVFILKDYNSEKLYSDTIVDNKKLFAEYSAIVFRNSLDSISFRYYIKPEIIKKENRFGIYVGLSVGKQNYINIELSDKKDMYGLSFDPFNKSINLNYKRYVFGF